MPGHGASFFLLLALLQAPRVAGVCESQDDVVFRAEFVASGGQQVTAQLLCGEDAADAAARVATQRKTTTTDGEVVLALAAKLQALLDQEAETGEKGYLPPTVLLTSSGNEVTRLLKSGGQYSRRAAAHARNEEYMEAAADLLRALLRKGLDATARDKLMATMEDFLKKAEAKRAEESEDGDLSELFEVLEMEDDTKSFDIDRSAVKKMYKKLSVKYHPDKNPESAGHFNQIRDAYEILSDPVKAHLFDTGGMELVRKYEGDSGELERTGNSEVVLAVTLEDAYSGATKKLRHERRVVCRACGRRPGLPRCERCSQCPDVIQTEQVWHNDHQYSLEEVEVPSDEMCADDVAVTEITVERGMSSGDQLSFPGMGSQVPKEIPGDLLVNLRVKEHKLFKRTGANLGITVRLTLREALLGFQREVVHLDGRKVTFGVDRGTVTRPDQALEIKGEGMPLKDDPARFGKLIVKFEVDFPERLNPEAADALEAALDSAGLKLGDRTVKPLPPKGRGRSRRSEL